MEEVLAGLKSTGMQDDARYAEAYIRNRVAKGYGPLGISRELRERGLTGELVEQALVTIDTDWEARIRAVRQKKYGRQAPADFREQARQSRFLQYRGFTSEQIRTAFSKSEAQTA